MRRRVQVACTPVSNSLESFFALLHLNSNKAFQLYLYMYRVSVFTISLNVIKIQKFSSFKSNENIHKREGGSYYVVSANKASSVTL